jgi:hypothetical protein
MLKYVPHSKGGWEIMYHIADYAEKIKMVTVKTRSDSLYL